ncbi:MAG: PhoX family phosphatase [Rhodospirillales bacterium]|nr:PhoX family phosphatase [Rhodospirillales bacterium]
MTSVRANDHAESPRGEGAEDAGCVATPAKTFGDIVLARYSRREAMAGLTAVAALSLLTPLRSGVARAAGAAGGSTLAFPEVPHGESETHVVADGYEAQTLIRWGDPISAGAPDFDPLNQTAERQSQQWGYNNDYVGYLPLPRGSDNPGRALLCVNFEYTDTHLMFPGLKDGEVDTVTKEQVDVELAAHGHGVVEIRRDDTANRWSVVLDSPYNRRITALATPCRVSGPAAGHPRLQTSADPTGRWVVGTLNNCAGGKTPWHTVLIAEENFDLYFAGDAAKTAEADNHKRIGIKSTSKYAWSRFYDRFNVDKEPNEPNRFGWMVELDPYDPKAVPVKRTALGRFKHEGATTVVNRDGRIVAYSGDDERFQYIYKFVSHGRFDADNRDANRDLLDDGVLFVARFEADGRLTWLPLVWGTGPLTPANGFASQADVLIEARRAGELLGATPMDRPEDVETNPVTGIVYVALTNNTSRKADGVNAGSPRGPNPHGHIVEMIPPGGRGADRDHAALDYRWEIFLLAGDPKNPEHGARYHPGVSENGWFSSPDNVAFDRQGRLWIATDGFPRYGVADGAYVTDTEGAGRALTRQFYRTPKGAELCGPELNGDDTAYFAAVQHPGDSKGSTFDAPSTRWPDFVQGMPPRPAVQVIVKRGGGTVGA